MKKVMIALLVLATVFSFVACNSNAVNEQMLTQDTVNVSFAPKLGGDTKAITVDINHADVSSVYWYYTATKQDGGGTVGATDGTNALAENKSGTTVNAGLNANGHEFSVGTWDFTLYGYLTSQNDSVTVESAEANCAYKATVTGKKLDLSAAKQTISMSAFAILTTGNEGVVGKGTLKVTTTHNVGSYGTAYTVKYSIDGGTNWIATGTDTTTSSTFCGSNKTVTLGLFNNESTPKEVVRKTITVSLYRGLTTTIGGTWDDPTVIGEFAVTGPWEVTFVSSFSDGATVQIVKDGENATEPTNPGNVSQAGITYKFMKWTTDDDPRESPAKAYVFDSISETGYSTLTAFDFTNTAIKADTTLNAVWVKAYTVTYDANGATGGTAPGAQTFVCGDDATLAENKGNLAKTDYTFNGWNTNATGTGTSYTAGAEVKGGLSGGDTTLYAEWKELPKVGGKIFYTTGSDNGATYKFFKQDGTEITDAQTNEDIKAGKFADAYYYSVTGTPSADKFYVYDNGTRSGSTCDATGGLATGKKWGYNGVKTDANGTIVGTGKTNTSTVLGLEKPSDWTGSIWEYVSNCRTVKVGGCNDWYIGSCYEVESIQYFESGWFSSNGMTSSREESIDSGSVWMSKGGGFWEPGSKSAASNKVVAIRSF